MNRSTPIESGALMNAARTPSGGSPGSIHRISGKARIAQFVMLAMMSGGGIFVLVGTLFGSAASNANEKVLFSIAGSGFIAAAIFLAIRVARYRVQVLDDRIRIQGALAVREILATDITGFRRIADGYAHTYLRLILQPPGKPVDLHRNLERSAEFEQWQGARATRSMSSCGRGGWAFPGTE